ncbi:hypothetical protein ACI78R_01000 [Geodermatophilus sp. SYSU D01106]
MVAAWVLVALAALLALGCAVAVGRLARPAGRPRRERRAADRAAARSADRTAARAAARSTDRPAARAAVPPPGRGARGR